MELQGKALVIIPEEELTGIQQTLEEILKQLSEIPQSEGAIPFSFRTHHSKRIYGSRPDLQVKV